MCNVIKNIHSDNIITTFAAQRKPMTKAIALQLMELEAVYI